MDLKLTDKFAVVTGSTAGIGQAIANSLAAEGARVVVNGRSQESVDAALKQMDLGDQAIGVAADVSTDEGCQTLLDRATDVAPIDILINNAGIFEPKPFEEITDQDWQKFFEVNVMSGVRMSRGVMESMRQRGWGRILFIASESAINIPVEMVHYGMTKTAQLAISRGLAKTLKDTGVTVNSVLPGPTWSEGVERFVKSLAGDGDLDSVKKNFFAENRPASLIQRFAKPEEVAAMATYLCGEQAGTTTGAAVRCDGGIVDTCF
ncbi:SDR family oxidoreductase [Roseiconus nitratireducens]|uniref:SDR family oxidoreductase n=1 Tax=Roseiconus nitratireducens TaxID=2605748 RepID=A0A5M6CZH7_9BACT|nr:SDR family oxidoreductase [Roseiconus nitratireducens]KAA5539432.1 SDR family oxidoreductase [Roseiconus nitratireducens]